MQRLDPATINEIVTLHRQGTSIKEIVRRTGRDRGAVRRAIRRVQDDDVATPEEIATVARAVELLQFSPALRRRFRSQITNALEAD